MSNVTLDYLVIGAGPAGLQVAYFLERRGCDYTVLEASTEAGAFFSVYPRHRTLISVNKRHTGSLDPEFNMKVDWNSLLSDDPDLLFTRYSDKYFPCADDLVRYLGDFVDKCGLRVEFGAKATRIAKSDGGFAVTTERSDVFTAKRIIMCTGVTPNPPEIAGIEHAEQYATVTTDPTDFTGQRVLILGKGNSAFETADSLMETAATIHVAGPNPVRLAWHTHFVGHLRAVNNNFLDTYELKLGNAILDVPVTSIAKSDGAYQVEFQFTGGRRVLSYDRVIVCTGFRFDSSAFAEDCLPARTVNDRFPALTGAYESINVPGLYFAGTVTQSVDFKHSTSGFIHGFRYGARALSHVLAERYEASPWPSREVAPEPAELTHALLANLNQSSALWQQFGTLADVVVVPPAGPARHYQEMPVRHVRERGFAAADKVFLATLEYGTHPRAAFDGVKELADARPVSSYFHPVVRQVVGDEVVAEIHLPSDLENHWWHPKRHVDALREFFDSSLELSVAR
ncbi:NAD(P)-binding domain-containing protein [Kutzneria sp. NPDC051319]|uniref:NAD(P)-binding domain-containing protein n=1 Tax=Kutzneria sp. NPDC051319 TaxID=3155047 RepID=UPI00342FBA39